MPEHYGNQIMNFMWFIGPTRLDGRKLAEREQAFLLAQGKPLKEVLAATERLLKPIAESASFQAENILDSETAKELKKQLDEQRATGAIQATPIRRLITTTTTTIEFADASVDTCAPPAYNE